MCNQVKIDQHKSGPIVLITLGTQGDIRPLLGFAVGLHQRGHHVRILTSVNFKHQIEREGISFYPLTGNYQELIQSNPDLCEKGLDLFAMIGLTRKQMLTWSEDWVEQGLVACQGASLLLGTSNASLLAAALGERLSLPIAYAQLQPLTPSRYLPNLIMPTRAIPGFIKQGINHSLRLAAWHVMQPAINQIVRPQLGLPPYPWYGPYFHPKTAVRVLYGFSSQLLRRPLDWPDNVHICGYWRLDQSSWVPPPDLLDFLSAGPPPIYIGFGSMPSTDARAFTHCIIAAVEQCGLRAVIASGWGGLLSNVDDIDRSRFFILLDAPHSWLFPRMAAAVHHGGAGTTGAALTAGIPSVVIPFYGDQPFWAHCLAQQRLAPPALTRRLLTPEILAQALREVCRPQMRKRAAMIGERIRQEDGIGSAIGQLMRWGILPSCSSENQVALSQQLPCAT